ncbi:benzaldehyde dehydrogenase [Xanthomonas arboricola pv. juglandis]|uniref:aldehyde dehydrogenase n=1 Tax=Xanthomonas sp. CPBF 426 TaxID=2750648 RepID=UPI000E5A8E14|nr:aldehyde dehydrogenase [Xanthomonas sp. CPBF 426]CAD1796234.1 aldehyde dehydrogenase [Xanthomonas sp. CPBF 426]SYZ51397.1 benzaldehyde dehydrogenase [Xanthomonas arboricola pv. juglandis]
MNIELVIDNRKQAGASGQSYQRLNPLSQQVVSTASAATAEDAVRAADSSARAFAAWSKVGPGERRRLLLAAANALEAKTDELCRVMAQEIGASALWAGFNVAASVALIREAAGLTTQAKGETIPTDRPGTLSMTLRQPVGAVLSIVPWNGPVILGARAIAYPLAFGNTVILKGSEQSPATHALLAEAFYEAGLPKGVLNFLTTTPEHAAEVTNALIAHKAVRRVNFTGSTKVGRVIAEECARHFKRCLLELGGKAPFVVLDDADIDGAVNAAVFGAFLYQGQICMSTERFVVDEAVADGFVEKFAARARALPARDPAQDPGCVVGPMIHPSSAERINRMLDDAVGKGARIVAGGRAEGAVMPATIVDGVRPGMDIYDEETFAPVTTIVRVRGAEEAVRIANDTAYGLSAAVFGRDVSRALQVAASIDSGSVHVNGATVQNEPQAPYGGMKNSGYGRFDGSAVIEEFTEIKWVTIEPSDQPYPF